LKNFAEELAYWYLRFNGFFPLTNFVLHRQDLLSSQNADADLIGVRPKFVSEEIGGNHLDNQLFKNFNRNRNIGVICEVKSGRTDPSDILMAREDRIRYALKRLGFFSDEKVHYHMERLENESVIRGRFHEVGKVLISDHPSDQPGFICIQLDHVESFVMERIELFLPEKNGAKHFFESDILQYMIWKKHRSE